MDENNVSEIRHPLYDSDHVKQIRDFLKSEEIDVQNIEKREKTIISWWLKYEGVDIMFMVYQEKVYRKEVQFVWLQALLAKLDNRNSEQVMKWMLNQNFHLPHPFKFAIDDERDAICLHMKICSDWLTKEHLHFRLENFASFVTEMQERLKREFDLRSFYEGKNVMLK